MKQLGKNKTPVPVYDNREGSSPKLLNKTFYKFLFSFIAVIAGVLMFILVLGVGSGVQ